MSRELLDAYRVIERRGSTEQFHGGLPLKARRSQATDGVEIVGNCSLIADGGARCQAFSEQITRSRCVSLLEGHIAEIEQRDSDPPGVLALPPDRQGILIVFLGQSGVAERGDDISEIVENHGLEVTILPFTERLD